MSDTFKNSLRGLATKKESQQAEANAVRQEEQRNVAQAEETKRALWLGLQATFTEKIGTVISPVIVAARDALKGRQIIIADSKLDKRGTQRFTCWLQSLPDGEVKQSILFLELEESGLVLTGIEKTSGFVKCDTVNPIRQRIPLEKFDRPRFEEVFCGYIKI